MLCREAHGLANYQIAFDLSDCCDIRPCTQKKQEKNTQHLMPKIMLAFMHWVYRSLQLLMQSQLDALCEVLEEVYKTTTSDDGNSKFKKAFDVLK